MWLGDQLQPQLTKDQLGFVDERHQWIISNGKLSNDDLLLLWDWITALRSNLYFASSSVLLVLLEKYLRMSLLLYRMKQENKDITTFMNKLEAVEETIEDETDGQKYRFHNLCDELNGLRLLDDIIIKELKDVYGRLRNPIQHGIYGRLIKKTIWEKQMPMMAVTLPDNATAQDVEKMFADVAGGNANTQGGIHNPITRIFVLPGLFQEICLWLLDLVQRVIAQIATNN